jgi:hypothetical protein
MDSWLLASLTSEPVVLSEAAFVTDTSRSASPVTAATGLPSASVVAGAPAIIRWAMAGSALRAARNLVLSNSSFVPSLDSWRPTWTGEPWMPSSPIAKVTASSSCPASAETEKSPLRIFVLPRELSVADLTSLLAAFTASTRACIFAATASGLLAMVSVTGVALFSLTVKVAPARTESNVFDDDVTATVVSVPMRILASTPMVLAAAVPGAPWNENLLAAPVSVDATRRAASPVFSWTTEAVSLSPVAALMAAAASASVPVPPTVMTGVTGSSFSSSTWIVDAP